jgi:hypothetical protein
MVPRPKKSNPTTTQPQPPSEEQPLAQVERLRGSLASLFDSVNLLLQASGWDDISTRVNPVYERCLDLCQVAVELGLDPPPEHVPSPWPEDPPLSGEFLSGLLPLPRVTRVPYRPWHQWLFHQRRWNIEAEAQLNAKDARGRCCDQPPTRKGRPRR